MGEPRETEVKLRVASAEAARESAAAGGRRLVRERHFEDNVLFDDADGLAPRERHGPAPAARRPTAAS